MPRIGKNTDLKIRLDKPNIILSANICKAFILTFDKEQKKQRHMTKNNLSQDFIWLMTQQLQFMF